MESKQPQRWHRPDTTSRPANAEKERLRDFVVNVENSLQELTTLLVDDYPNAQQFSMDALYSASVISRAAKELQYLFAVAAVEHGVSQRSVSATAGVSNGTVANWMSASTDSRSIPSERSNSAPSSPSE